MTTIMIILLIGAVQITAYTIAKGMIEKNIADKLAGAEEVQQQIATLQGGGIGCDNPTCNFIDRSVKIDDFESWVDKPCPNCGENLLTKEDYNRSQQLLQAMDMVNNLSPEKIEEMMKQVDVEKLLETPFFQEMSKTDKDELQDLASGMMGEGAIFERNIFISTHDGINIDSVVKPSESAYILTRDVNQSECKWLERDFPYGEIVYRYFGNTEEEVSSTGFAFSLEKGQTPYFELPIDSVELVDKVEDDGVGE